MTGLKKIINKIETDNADKCDRIISSAEKQAQEIIDKAVSDAQNQADDIIAKANEKCGKIAEIDLSRNQQIQKQAVLSTKVKLINDVIEKASRKLDSMDDSSYFAFLLKLIEKYSREGECEMLLNKKDFSRVPEGFVSKAKETALKNGAVLTLSQENADIKNGLILKYGLIEINCSFDALIDENREDIKEKINSLLF